MGGIIEETIRISSFCLCNQLEKLTKGEELTSEVSFKQTQIETILTRLGIPIERLPPAINSLLNKGILIIEKNDPEVTYKLGTEQLRTYKEDCERLNYEIIQL